MKKFKNSSIIISLLLIVLILASCQNRMQEPAIKISYKSKELKPFYFGNRNNKDKEDIEKMIKNVMVGKRFAEYYATWILPIRFMIPIIHDWIPSFA